MVDLVKMGPADESKDENAVNTVRGLHHLEFLHFASGVLYHQRQKAKVPQGKVKEVMLYSSFSISKTFYWG